MRNIKRIVFKGHGQKVSPKASKEADLILEDKETIDKVLKSFIFYLQSDVVEELPTLNFSQGALKDKKIKMMGIDHQTQSLVVFVEKE